MIDLIVSFIAWVLTILSPCVLPLLPIILWASAENTQDKFRPLIIIISLSFSIIVFSLLLKGTTYFIDIDPIVWKIFSWVLIILFWIITLFPNLWKNFSNKIGFSNSSSQLLWKSSQKKWNLWTIMVWISLWPVFASCSPTYAIILAVILPVSFFFWILNLIAYVTWLWIVLLLIAILWQKFIWKIKWISSPNSKFKKILWILFLFLGISIILWWDKMLESYIIELGLFDITNFEQNLSDKIKGE